ncbi:MAG: sigma-54-dependent Fis family transcriptional regulator [Myxococcales bacterium]|nr:sigma-54-dependent Fis family transcriptional regulator [Myxococcales bacterium]
MGSLVLGDISEDVWSAYQARAGGVRAPGPLLAAWERSRRLGASPSGVTGDDGLLRGEALRARAERVELLRVVGAAGLDRAAGELAARDHVLLLADADGVVVGVSGGGGFADEARRVRLIEGACWSEAARGTNAIGTAAAEGRPVTVVGRAHYARSYHGLVCVAAPVRDFDGEVRAVLDATSVATRADPEVARAVCAGASALERLLRLEAYAEAGAGVLQTLSRALERVQGATLLVESPGRVARVSSGARGLLGERGERCEAWLGASWAGLVAEGLRPTSAGLRGVNGGRALRLRVEPIVAPRGVLAVVVYVEPEARAVARPVRAPADAFAGIFCADATVRAQLEWARKLAASAVPVMLLAETGAGKELVARAVHEASPRASGPFVAVNCGAIAPSLLESELFGHAAGAFTGASRRGHAGLIEAASGGTLFLDEVAEMPPAMQATLLRVLEDGGHRRVGETVVRRADVRLVCATCRDLPALVASGGFRQDLYYRLRGGVVRLAPLRGRTDVVALAGHLLGKLAAQAGRAAPRLAAGAAARLQAHAWPGNVRELRACLDVALVIAGDAEVLEAEHLPPELDAGPPAPVAPLAELASRAIGAALREAGGNVSAAARSLGVARSTLYRRRRREGATD